MPLGWFLSKMEDLAMADKTDYEHGARKLMAKSGRDPNDEFSQKAAANKKPPLGVGLTEKVAPKKPSTRSKDEKAPPDPEHPTRDTRDTPAPNPNGNPVTIEKKPPDS